jgi:hypothetical protein
MESALFTSGTVIDAVFGEDGGFSIASEEQSVTYGTANVSVYDIDDTSKTVAESDSLSAAEVISASVIMSACIAATIVGNVLVILSVFTYRPLRGVQNFYIVSLAVADLAVAVLVMPFNVAYFVMRGRWAFGLVFCHIWLTADILTCTASILNLCAIALDRYRAIHDPIGYAQRRTVGRVLLSVGAVWMASALISVPPLIGWNRGADSLYNPTTARCQLTDAPGFVVYSASGSFYIPLALMTFVYVKIFRATRRRLRSRARTFAATATSAVTSFPAAYSGGGRAGSSGGCGDGAPAYTEAMQTNLVPGLPDPCVSECSASSIEDDDYNMDAGRAPAAPDVVGSENWSGQPTVNCSTNTLSVPTDSRLSANSLKSMATVSAGGGSESNLTDCCCETLASAVSSPTDQPQLHADHLGQHFVNCSKDVHLSVEEVVDLLRRCPENVPHSCRCRDREHSPPSSSFRKSGHHHHHRCSDDRCCSGSARRIDRAPCRCCPGVASKRSDEPRASSADVVRPINENKIGQLTLGLYCASSIGRDSERLSPTSAAANGFRRAPTSDIRRSPSGRSAVHADSASTACNSVPSGIGTATAAVSRIMAEKQRQSAAKERRVARTMAIIMAAFVVCWLPFFVMYVVFPFCGGCADSVDQRVISFIVWLGYINSTLNPVIYTIFNVDFRRAFKALLTPRRRR